MLQPKQYIRVVGYPRVSDETVKTDSTTLESQAKAIRIYVDEHSEMILIEMKPEAKTAYMKPFKKRPVFMDIIDMARKGMIDGVVVTEFGRLSRRQGEQVVIVKLLRSYNVTVYSCTENFDESALGQFMRTSGALSDEQEREKMVHRTQRGMRDRVEAGNLTGRGRASYGYKFANTKDYTNAVYVVYEEEAKIVRWIFERAAEGRSMRRIARTLTEMGVPTSRKGNGKNPSEAWNYGTIGKILENPYYTGSRATALRYKKGENGHSEKYAEIGHVQLPEGVVPQIVSEELFDRVQQQLAMKRQSTLLNNKYPHIGIMRGLVRCGICGHNCQVNNRHTITGKLRSYYLCKKNEGIENDKFHHSVSIETHLLDALLWEKAIEFLENSQAVQTHIEQFHRQNELIIDNAKIAELLRIVRIRYTRLLDVVETAEDDDIYRELRGRLSAIEKEKQVLEELLIDSDIEVEHAKEVEKEIVLFEQWVNDVQPLLRNPDYEPTFKEKRMAILASGMRVLLWPVSAEKRYEIKIEQPNIMNLLEGMRLIQ